MDHYVHDAIAGFLADDRTEVIGHIKDLVRYKQLLDGDERFALNARRLGISLSDEEQGYAAYYERTGRIPPGMPVDAREPSWLGAGYLRSRRIYAGADDVLLTQASPSTAPGLAQGGAATRSQSTA